MSGDGLALIPQRGHRELGRLVAQPLRPTFTEDAGRQGAAQPFGHRGDLEIGSAHQLADEPVADRPLLQRVDLDGHGVLDAVDLPRQRVVEFAEEALHRMLEEAQQVGEFDVVAWQFGQQPGQERLRSPTAHRRRPLPREARSGRR